METQKGSKKGRVIGFHAWKIARKKTGFLTQKSDKKMLLSGFGVNQPMMYNFHKSNSAGKDLVKEASVKVPAAACTEDCPKASATHMLTTSFRPTQ